MSHQKSYRATQSIFYLGVHHRVLVADRSDAFEDRCSTGLAVAHVRNDDDHPAQLHGIVTTLKMLDMRVGTLPSSLVPAGQL